MQLAVFVTNKEDRGIQATDPAMRTRSRFRAAAQEVMLSCFDVGQHKISARTLASKKLPQKVLAAVLNEDTGELMEYCHLIGNPMYQGLWQYSYSNEVRRLTQGMPG